MISSFIDATTLEVDECSEYPASSFACTTFHLLHQTKHSKNFCCLSVSFSAQCGIPCFTTLSIKRCALFVVCLNHRESSI